VLYIKWSEFNKIFGNTISMTSNVQDYCKWTLFAQL